MWFFAIFLLLAARCLGFVTRASAPVCRHTSLIAARKWLIGAGSAVVVMMASDFVFRLWPDRMADYGWYSTSILLLCPPIAVLGARRPGVHVWTWFILVPMIAVLSWPVWTVLLQGSELRGLALELPTALGFGLVLIMGVGNYLGTRYVVCAVLYLMGTLLMFLSCTGWSQITEPSLCRIGAVGLLMASVFPPRGSRMSRHPANQLWDDFRNSFGIVWSLRMVERINAYAEQESWTIHMTWEGFPETDDGELMGNAPEVRDACRWLFRRFVDDEWIDQRLSDAS